MDLITLSSYQDFAWRARRPRDSSPDVKKAQKTLRNKPLKIEKALDEMKRKFPD